MTIRGLLGGFDCSETWAGRIRVFGGRVLSGYRRRFLLDGWFSWLGLELNFGWVQF
jgi:hypothetical protein